MSIIGKKLNSEVLLSKPRITEKAAALSERTAPIYTFEVSESAGKIEIKKAIETAYKVKPVKVNIVNLPAKKVFRRGKLGSKSAVRKAMVFLKAGDKIELV